MESRAPIIFALLMLLFFVSTSAGFANVSGIQEQLRFIQLNLIREKIKLLQQGIIKAGEQQVQERETAKSKLSPVVLTEEPDREKLAQVLQKQVQTLNGVIAALKPRAIEQRTEQIEKRIAEIKAEVKTAAGIKLQELQNELNDLFGQYEALQEEVKQALAESITYRQALVIGEQIRAVQAKVQVLPQEILKPAVAQAAAPPVDPAVRAVEAEVEKLRLKVMQAQVKAIQEKINQLTR